jgi:hypothetical protein
MREVIATQDSASHSVIRILNLFRVSIFDIRILRRASALHSRAAFRYSPQRRRTARQQG